MAGFSIQAFRSELIGGGARPNLFEVQVPFPGVAGVPGADRKMTFMCKGSQIPGADIAPVPVPYFGREIKLAGNRTFAEWTTTVINDEDFTVHAALVNWMNAINGHESNLMDQSIASGGGSGVLFPIAVSTGYAADAQVIQYTKDGNLAKRVTLVNCWPASIPAIELGWDQNDAIEEFAVTWQYDFWRTEDSSTFTT